jgi:3-isopropylmalate/(R)-2-methylmalate dehydratase small subunit
VELAVQPFTVYTGIAVPLDRPNVDTDQIIPKQFLKRIERTGFGQYLFYDWRFDADGHQNPRFEPNAERYKDAGVLVAGRNFGCGSSREHAVWALHDYGIKAVIAPSFADIFRNNALGNGLLPVELPDEQVEELVQRIRATLGYRLTVDLEAQQVRGERVAYPFEIDPYIRYRLLNGLDDIGLTLQQEGAIEEYEARRAVAAGVPETSVRWSF